MCDERTTASDPLFDFPRKYDKSYRINFSVMTEDLSYSLRKLQQRREDEGRKG